LGESKKGFVERLFAEHQSALQAFFYRHLVPARELKVAVAGRWTQRASVKFWAMRL